MTKYNNCEGAGMENILGKLANGRIADKFLENRTICLWGEISDESSRRVVDQLMYLEMTNPGQQITMYISSPGGSVTAGNSILDTMRLISSPVKTVCMGMCASMASLLLSAGEKGTREIFPLGEVMIHQPLIGGYFQEKASNLEITANSIMKTKRQVAQILADNCGKDVEQVMKDIEEDYYLDANEALEYGIVDKITSKISF